MKSLKSYLTPQFWRINVDFCIQYIHIDYGIMMVIENIEDSNEAFDLDKTEDVVAHHLDTLANLAHLADQYEACDAKDPGKLLLKASFFRDYNSIIKRVLLQSSSINYALAPDTHKKIKNYREFLSAYSDTISKISSGELNSMSERLVELDAEVEKQKQKEDSKKSKAKKKQKVVQITDLALDRFSKGKHNGN